MKGHLENHKTVLLYKRSKETVRTRNLYSLDNEEISRNNARIIHKFHEDFTRNLSLSKEGRINRILIKRTEILRSFMQFVICNLYLIALQIQKFLSTFFYSDTKYVMIENTDYKYKLIEISEHFPSFTEIIVKRALNA